MPLAKTVGQTGMAPGLNQGKSVAGQSSRWFLATNSLFPIAEVYAGNDGERRPWSQRSEEYEGQADRSTLWLSSMQVSL